jgi:hypothetical protein
MFLLVATPGDFSARKKCRQENRANNCDKYLADSDGIAADRQEGIRS